MNNDTARSQSTFADALSKLPSWVRLLAKPETTAEVMPKGRHRVPSPSALHVLQQMLGITPTEGLEDQLKDVIFVCIDCEAFEHAQHKITEIGVAVLDTWDTIGLTANSSQDSWLSKLKYAHYRPIEYAGLVNKNFIKGCPENFNFGITTWIKLRDANETMRRLFRDPARLAVAADLTSEMANSPRNIVFVAHGASNDKAYLNSLGFSMDSVSGVVRTMDTQTLCGGTKKKQVALRRLLLSLGLEPVNLHNAGNDAAYTLQSLVLMALKDHATSGSVLTDLARFAGKLPSAVYHNRKAPEIWAGSATKELSRDKDRDHDLSKLRYVGGRRIAPSRPGIDERRRRKEMFRAAHVQGSSGSEDTFDRGFSFLGEADRGDGTASAGLPRGSTAMTTDMGPSREAHLEDPVTNHHLRQTPTEENR